MDNKKAPQKSGAKKPMPKAKNVSTKAKTEAAADMKTAKKPAPKKSASKAKNVNTKTKTEAAQDNMSLSDYDIISDVLGTHKNLIGLYGTAICEIDCPNLRKIINTQLTECATDQLDSFNYMHDRGMYKTEPAPIPKIRAARQKYCNALTKSPSKK